MVDSGVDYSPQLAGKVTAIDLTRTGYQDCRWATARRWRRIIAASDMQAQGSPFAGVAPEAKILSVKVYNADVGNSPSPWPRESATLPSAALGSSTYR